MKIYIVKHLNHNGTTDILGFYFNKDNAAARQKEVDGWFYSKKYGIKAYVDEIEIDDELSNKSQ